MKKIILIAFCLLTVSLFAANSVVGTVQSDKQQLSSGFWYTVKKHTTSGMDGENLPMVYALHQNYPNPFNPTTTIKFDLPAADQISLKIYNITGAQVCELARGNFARGFHTVSFDAAGLSSGIYFYHLSALNGKFSKIMKMSVVK